MKLNKILGSNVKEHGIFWNGVYIGFAIAIFSVAGAYVLSLAPK